VAQRPVSCRAGLAVIAAARRSRAEPPSTGPLWSPDLAQRIREKARRRSAAPGGRSCVWPAHDPCRHGYPLPAATPLPPEWFGLRMIRADVDTRCRQRLRCLQNPRSKYRRNLLTEFCSVAIQVT
jgi:glyoxylase-like metal-dependent hydrolase (beta-lactamase superfamily II)